VREREIERDRERESDSGREGVIVGEKE